MSQENRQDLTRMIKSAFFDLFDCLIYANRAEDCRKDLESMKAGYTDRKKRVDELQSQLISLLTAYSQEEKSAFFQGIKETLMNFISSSLEDFKNKITPGNSDQINAKQEEMNAYMSKSLRSAEIFLSRNYLPVTDSGISLKFVSGANDCRYRATSPKELEYEFLLDNSEIEFMKTRIFPSSFQKGIRVPVRLGKSWMSKDPVPDFEKLDEYYISSANLSSGDLFIRLSHEEAGSEIMIHQTNTDSNTFLEVEYQDAMGKISVTSEPALNSNLEREGILVICRQIRNTLKLLEDKKLRLTALSVRGSNLLETRNFEPLIIAVFEILGPFIKNTITEILSGAKIGEGDFTLTRDVIVDRLKLVPGVSSAVSSLIGASGITDGVN